MDARKEIKFIKRLVASAADNIESALGTIGPYDQRGHYTYNGDQLANHLSDVEVDLEAAVKKAQAIQLMLAEHRRAIAQGLTQGLTKGQEG